MDYCPSMFLSLSHVTFSNSGKIVSVLPTYEDCQCSNDMTRKSDKDYIVLLKWLKTLVRIIYPELTDGK